jgi:nucleotide-binding universal stress UspA family protein
MNSPSSLLRRRKFLVVVDKTPEHRVAVRFAARRAQHTNGVVSLLAVVPSPDKQQWSSIQALMSDEAYEEAQSILHLAASDLYEVCGRLPELVIREGKKRDVVMELIKQDPDISILVLAAGTAREGPGPLVAAVAGDPKFAYPIPVTIVPGGLSDAEIDALA